MMREIAKRHVFIPNEAFLVAKSALGPHRANPRAVKQDFFKKRSWKMWESPEKGSRQTGHKIKLQARLI